MTLPKVGEIVDGYTYKGGDPNNQASWEQAASAPAPLKVGDVVDGYSYKGGDPNSQESWQEVAKDSVLKDRPLTGSEKASKYALQGLQFVGGMLPFGISSITTTPATEYGIGKIEGKPQNEIKRNVLTAGLIDAGVTATGIGALPIVGGFMKGAARAGAKSGIKSLLKTGAKEAGEVMTKRVVDAELKRGLQQAATKGATQAAPGAMAKISELLAGVPKEAAQRAIDKEKTGESIFSGAWNPKEAYQKIGNKVQDAVNWLENATARQAGIEQQALRGHKDPVNVNHVLAKGNDFLSAQKFGRESALNVADQKKIVGYLQKLSQRNLTPGELHAIKTQIQNDVSWSMGRIKETSEVGEMILKKIRKEIDNTLSVISPEYKAANMEYSKIEGVKDSLLSRIKDQRVARTMHNYHSMDIPSQEDLKMLDEMVPEHMRFMGDLENTTAREPFEMIMPARGYTTGGGANTAQGIGNIVRGSLVGAGAAKNPYLLPLAAIFSPKTHKAAIRGAYALKKGLPAGSYKEGLISIADLIGERGSR